jgi:hypothetical protein
MKKLSLILNVLLTCALFLMLVAFGLPPASAQAAPTVEANVDVAEEPELIF